MKTQKEKFQFPIYDNEPAWRFVPKTGATEEPSASPAAEQVFEKEEEGELKVDVYQNENAIVIKSAVAGTRLEDLQITLNHDMLTIRGKRELDEEVERENYFYQECFWGKFSRSIILPTVVDASKTKARLKNGILTITLPKIIKDFGTIQVKQLAD
jgi:HSP20 family protein